jgi:hypothetical protein
MRKSFRQPLVNPFLRDRVVSVFRNALEFSVDANHQRLVRLHMKISRAASLTPLEQLTEPGLWLNGLHVVGLT